jgi:hypothetical protein
VQTGPPTGSNIEVGVRLVAAQAQGHTHAHRVGTRIQAAQYPAHRSIEAQAGPGAVIEARSGTGSQLSSAPAVAFYKVAGLIADGCGEGQRADILAGYLTIEEVGPCEARLHKAEVALQDGPAAYLLA